MAIDCIIDLECKVKEALSLEGMVSMIKNRNRAVTIMEMMKKQGKTEEEALNAKFQFHMIGLDGISEPREYKVQDLLESTLPLDTLQTSCDSCPIGVGNRFGCYISINYPISGMAEHWLIDMSKKAMEKGVPDCIPLNYIIDQKVPGDIFEQMRKDPGGTFFELKEPPEIVISKGILSKKAVNTNQIFTIFFGLGPLISPHMKMLLYFTGGLKIRNEQPEVAGVVGRAIHLTDDKSILMLKEFFRAMFIAYGLERKMIIDF